MLGIGVLRHIYQGFKHYKMVTGTRSSNGTSVYNLYFKPKFALFLAREYVLGNSISIGLQDIEAGAGNYCIYGCGGAYNTNLSYPVYCCKIVGTDYIVAKVTSADEVSTTVTWTLTGVATGYFIALFIG